MSQPNYDEPEYTKMCKASKEIQELSEIWEREPTLEDLIDLCQTEDPEIKTPALTLGAVIQGLHEFYDPEHFCPSDETCDECKTKGNYRRRAFKTIKQYMLAFTMQERFNKVWSIALGEWVQQRAIQE